MTHDRRPPGQGSDTPPAPVGFGLATATFVVVSSMVGVGVLTTSGHIVAQVGSNAIMLLLWAIGGVIALCGALSLAELAAMLPHSGGEYIFLREAYGPRIAFVGGAVSVVIGFAAPIAAASLASADYLLAAFPIKAGILPAARLLIATSAILTFTWLHSASHSRTARTQGIVTVLEIVLLGLFVLAGLAASRLDLSRLNDITATGMTLNLKIIFSMVYVSYGYTGWNAAAYVAGEVAQGDRRLPRAIVLGTVCVTLLYLGLNLVYALALPASEITRIVAEKGEDAVDPIAELAANALFGPFWARPFSIGVGVILLATTSAYLLTGPRTMFAMAVRGDLPQAVARIRRKHGTPARATRILAIVALGFLWTGSFDTIVVYAGVGLSLISLLSVSAVYVLRRTRANLPRPFRVPLYPIVPAIYLVGTLTVVIVAFYERPATSAVALVSLLVAVPAYDFWMRRKPRAQVDDPTA